jgi:hypothetical protein
VVNKQASRINPGRCEIYNSSWISRKSNVMHARANNAENSIVSTECLELLRDRHGFGVNYVSPTSEEKALNLLLAFVSVYAFRKRRS